MALKQISIKTPEEIKVMKQGGRLLGEVRDQLALAVKPGVTPIVIEKLANKLIEKTGGVASFKMVPGYSWATCININEEVVHAIPRDREIMSGDIVGIDVGLFYKGWHSDTAVTVACPEADKRTNDFLIIGKKALNLAIKRVRAGNRVIDLSEVMEETVTNAGYSVVRALTGHGVGRQLHEEPPIPCFVMGDRNDSPVIKEGMVLAIEVMYNMGGSDIAYKDRDGWTIITADGKISGLFEETVAVTDNGPVILTQPQKR